MNYGKKDEDSDSGLVRVDRTQVFQEGQTARLAVPPLAHLDVAPREDDANEPARSQRASSTSRPSKPESAESS